MAYTSKPDGSDSIQDSDQVIKANFDFLALAIAQEHGWNTSDETATVHNSASFAGSETTDMSAATVNVTGVGFQPDIVIAMSYTYNGTADNAWSIGLASGTTEMCLSTAADGDVVGGSGYFLRLGDDVSNYTTAPIDSMDADGFSFTKSQTLSPGAGSVIVFFLAIKLA